MKKVWISCLFLLTATLMWGQKERKVIREGLRAYKDGEFSEAEIQFRRAWDINQGSFEAEFNTGAALYGQEKYEETVRQYESLVHQSQIAGEEDAERLAHIWHNMGNSLLEAEQYEPSIEAYKNSLRLNPDDFDSKYNLAYARKKLNEQQQQQQQQQQQNQDEQEGEQDRQEGEENKADSREEQNQDDRQANEEQQEQQKGQEEEADQRPQEQSREISKEDAERMLNAIQQQEKEVKEKVDKKKATAAKVKTKKDW